MDLGLKNKNAIITGATKGIGLATAKVLVAEGASVAICGRDPEGVDVALSSLSDAGPGEAIGAVVDGGDKDALQSWINNTAVKMGGLDILVPMVSGKGPQEGEEAWDAVYKLDMLATARAIEAALPHLQDSKAAAIVCIGSTSALEEWVAPGAYNAMKAAVIVHAEQQGLFLAPQGIRVNSVSPGPTQSEGGDWEIINQMMPEFYDATVAKQPMGRLGKPEEIANAIAFLASPAASWITGINLVVDGGITKRMQL